LVYKVGCEKLNWEKDISYLVMKKTILYQKFTALF
jgi:hypothetical protein